MSSDFPPMMMLYCCTYQCTSTKDTIDYELWTTNENKNELSNLGLLKKWIFFLQITTWVVGTNDKYLGGCATFKCMK